MGLAMIEDIDLHMGRRLRRRRLILGLTQQQLGSRTGVRFQQVQKFECAANRMSAEKLWKFAQALDAPITYFYDGLANGKTTRPDRGGDQPDVLASQETTDLVDAYYRLKERPRRHLLDLAKALHREDARA
jgi:transcriptional regulator with XRE-family HTH domain